VNTSGRQLQPSVKTRNTKLHTNQTDKLCDRKTTVALYVQILLSVFSSLGGAVSLLLLLVPVGRVPVTYPDRVVLDVGCGLQQEGYLDLGVAGAPPCNYVPSLTQGKIKQVDNGRHKQIFI
jgi:hypothetical protein